MKHSYGLLVALVLCTMPACSDDPEIVRPEPVSFQNLSEREDVLFNLREAYNQHNAAEYNRLVDDDFVFRFAPADYASGSTPESWDRVQDSLATRRLLKDVIEGGVEIDFDTAQWVDVTPDSLPDEAWFCTTVNYTFSLRFGRDPETTFITVGQPQVRFVVRRVDVNGNERWRLVEWQDLAGVFTFKQELAQESTSWGKIKALYQE